MTNFLPKDLTPAQRAALKLASHFALIGIFNALLAGYVFFSDGASFSWRGLLLVVGAQAVLAILDALKKYVTAQGDMPYSSLIELARLQLAQRAPQVVYTPAQQAFQQGISAVFDPAAYVANYAPAPAAPAPVSAPVSLPVAPAAAAPAPAVSAPAPVDASLQDTAPRPVVAPAQ